MAGPADRDGPPTSAGTDVERGAEGSATADQDRPLYAPVVPGWEQVPTLAPSLPTMQRAMERPAASLTTRRPAAAPVSSAPLGHVVEEDAPTGLVVARAVSAPAPTEDDTPAPDMPLRPTPKKQQPPKRPPVVVEPVEDEPDFDEPVAVDEAPDGDPAPARPAPARAEAAPLPRGEIDTTEVETGDDEPFTFDEPEPAPVVRPQPLTRPIPTVDVAPPAPAPQTRAAEAPLPLPVSRLVTVDRPVDDLPLASPPQEPPASDPAAAVTAEPVADEPAPPQADEPAPGTPTVTTTLGQHPSLAAPSEPAEEADDHAPAPLATPTPTTAPRPSTAIDPTPPEPAPEAETPTSPAPVERPNPLTSLTRGMRDIVAQRFTGDAPEPVVEDAEAAPPLAAPPAAEPEGEPRVEPAAAPVSTPAEADDEVEPDEPEETLAAPVAPETTRPLAPVSRSEPRPSLAGRPLPLVVARQVSQPDPRPAPPVEVHRRVEAATGVPLPRVTVNRDASADRTTQAHQARAVTVGDTVHMRPDEGPLDEPQGRGLVAHELVHVAQQQVLGAPPAPESDAGRALEASAQRAEDAEVAGRTLPSMPLTAPSRPSREPGAPGPTPLPLAPVAPPAPSMDSIVNQVVASAPPGTVQRSAEGGIEVVAPSATEPPPTVATPPSAPVAAAPATVQRYAEGAPEPKSRVSDGDLDEQARRLYPRLRSMLAAELRLERERAGRLSDVRY